MNVLIAAEYAAPFGGNFIGSLQDLARRLHQRGDQVTFLFPTPQDGPRPWADWLRRSGFEVILADPSLSQAEQLRFLDGVLRRHDIDLIHVHFEQYLHLFRKHYRELKPVKVLIHDHMGFATGRSLAKQKLRLAAHSLDFAKNGFGLITVSRQKKKAYPFTCKKWYVPNGLSLLRNVDRFADREETRAELGLEEDEILCTLFGWLMKLKGLDIAVKAISALRQQGHKVLLGIIGGHREGYADFIRACDVDPDSDWIRYLGSREDIYSLHRAADVFMSLSRNEGFPYGILEAISQNAPIVVSDIPETRWAMDYSKASTYPVEDPAACAEAILRAAAMGRADSNAAQIMERYSIDAWCSRVMELYDRMMK